MTSAPAPPHRDPVASLGGSVRVEPMRSRHLSAVLDIEERSFPRPWPRMVFAAELDKPGRRYVVARLNRRIVGYGGVIDQGGDVHLTTVAVAPALRGRRIAARLVYELILVARDLTPTGGLTLEVREGNDAARRLYAGFGFAEEGRRPGYYADNGEDAVILWLRDLHGPDVSATLERWRSQLDLPAPRA